MTPATCAGGPEPRCATSGRCARAAGTVEQAAALEREMKKQKVALHLGTKVEDRRDNADGSITLTLSGGTVGASLIGTSTVNAVAGVATFEGDDDLRRILPRLGIKRRSRQVIQGCKQ